jgi:hypothetical protein
MPINRDFLHKHAKNPQVQQVAGSAACPLIGIFCPGAFGALYAKDPQVQ